MSPVNHPPHYGGANNQYETIKVIEAWKLDFFLGNAVKYISRAGKKHSTIEDLEKAKWYIDRKIAQCEPVKESETVFFDSLIEKLDKLIKECTENEFYYFDKGCDDLENIEKVKIEAYIYVKQLLLNS